jgi:ABC-type polysaccharide/polyol phosphate export permease
VSQLFAQLKASIRKPEFWAYSSWLDLVTRYRRTRLGLLWLFAPVLMFTLVIGPLFARLMDRELSYFLVHFGIGQAVWRMLAMVITDSTNALRTNKSFILDGNTRLTDFALSSIAKSVFYFAFAMVGMMVVLAWSPAVKLYWVPSLLITIPIVIANMFWLSYCIAILGARYPDFGQMLNTLLMAGFMFTPIIWEGERFPPDTIAGTVVRLNPAFHLLEIVRKPLFGMMPGVESIIFVAAFFVAGWAFATFLCRRYARYVPIWI